MKLRSEHRPNDDLFNGVLDKLKAGYVVPGDGRGAVHYFARYDLDELRLDVFHFGHVDVVIIVVVVVACVVTITTATTTTVSLLLFFVIPYGQIELRVNASSTKNDYLRNIKFL
jgi:hypothetical protein